MSTSIVLDMTLLFLIFLFFSIVSEKNKENHRGELIQRKMREKTEMELKMQIE